MIHSLIKYPGSKKWLVPFMAELANIIPIQSYSELFLGSGVVALNMPSSINKFVGDICPNLINFHIGVRHGHQMSNLPAATPESYEQARNQFNNIVDTRTHIINYNQRLYELYYYINKVGYNGLMRYNKKGHINTPMGSYRGRLPEPDITHAQQSMVDWSIFNSTYESIPVYINSLVYVDPPYYNTFTNYSSNGFTWDDQVKLVRYLSAMDDTTRIIASNSNEDRIRELYKQYDFTIMEVKVTRTISCKSEDRKKVKELLMFRNFTPDDMSIIQELMINKELA